MVWVRLDDAFPGHPKYLKLGRYAPIAQLIQVRALCYCNRYLTDGHVTPEALAEITRDLEAWGVLEWGGGDPAVGGGRDALEIDWAQLMVTAHVWEPNGDGWMIHDYLEYQKSRREVEDEQAKARERMARVRAKRAGSLEVRANGSGEVQPNGSGERSQHRSLARPVPSRPVPKDKDSALTRNANGTPTPLREVLRGQRLRLEPQPPATASPPAADRPGTDTDSAAAEEW